MSGLRGGFGRPFCLEHADARGGTVPCRTDSDKTSPMTLFPIRHAAACFLAALALVPVSIGRGHAAEVVDLELVLAIDASDSVDQREYRLQLQGMANGFRDAAVIQALKSGPTGRIAVAVVLWADPTKPARTSDWYILASARDAEAFAKVVEGLPRTVGGGTGIGAAIAQAVRLIETNDITSLRRVIDVSGDGLETTARDEGILVVSRARSIARRSGVTVNGLAILSDLPGLAAWYAANVTSGPGSFVISARDFVDFERAMRLKLLREISPPIAQIRKNPP